VTETHRGAVVTPGVLLGTGLGGFLDGIVFHQVLQWHNMLSSIVPPVDLVSMKYNMVFDGLFHAFTWFVTAVGVLLLWRAGLRPNVVWSTRTFVGSLALGWGLFNLVEGLVDHHIYGLHHVHPGAHQAVWDLGFLAFGALLAAGGVALIRSGRRDTSRLREYQGRARGERLDPHPGSAR
jgi:uncharacterized membrane protein